MWTEITRSKYERAASRYVSDVMDAEWTLVGPLLPEPKRLCRPRTTALREVVNAHSCMMRSGCQWRLLPEGFPPRSTVQRDVYARPGDGAWRCINHELLMRARLADGREAGPAAGAIDSRPAFAEAKHRLRGGRSVKTRESGGPRGFDAGKKVKGRKRHILADTGGLTVGAVVYGTDIQDRDGAPLVLAAIRLAIPWLRHVFADGGYAGPKLECVLHRLGRWSLEFLKRPDQATGFEVLPRRWVVEHTFAWLGRNRRLAKNFKATLESVEAWLFLASIQLFLRRLANP